MRFVTIRVVHPIREQKILSSLEQRFPGSKSRQYLELFKMIDPTSSGKYTTWLTSLWLASEFSADTLEEDAELLHELLKKFHLFKKQLPAEQRDIMRHTKGSLAMALAGFELPEGTKNEIYEKKVLAGRELLHQDDEFRVIQLTTPEAARRTSQKTAWCVSSLRVAADYLASGPLFVFERWNAEQADYLPVALAHHGYSRYQPHVEADSYYRVTSQLKNVKDLDVFSHDKELFEDLLPYVRLALNDVINHKLRKIADAWEAEYIKNFPDTADEVDTRFGLTSLDKIGSLETDEEYYLRLMEMRDIYGDTRIPEIEKKILESNDSNIIASYMITNFIIDPRLEKHLIHEHHKRTYISAMYDKLVRGPYAGHDDGFSRWVEIAERINAG